MVKTRISTGFKNLSIGFAAFLVALAVACALPFVFKQQTAPVVSADAPVPSIAGGSWQDIDFDEAGNVIYFNNELTSGEGTLLKPFTISTAEQLALLAYLVNKSDTSGYTRENTAFAGAVQSRGPAFYRSAVYKVVNHLSLANRNWVPIGTPENPFSGYIYGAYSYDTAIAPPAVWVDMGVTITDLTIINTAAQPDLNMPSNYIGLFGFVREGLIFKLGLKNTYIDVDGNCVGSFAGAIVGDGVTEPITVSNAVLVASAGLNEVYNTGFISGGNYVGGLVGRVCDGAALFNNYNTADVFAKNASASVGGIAGVMDIYTAVNNNIAIITFTYNTGNVSRFSGESTNIGGILGTKASDSGDSLTSTNRYLDTCVGIVNNANMYGFPLEELDMQTKGSYNTWNFRTDIDYPAGFWVRQDTTFKWKMIGSFNNGFPVLSSTIQLVDIDLCVSEESAGLGTVKFSTFLGDSQLPVIDGTGYQEMGTEVTLEAVPVNTKKARFVEWKVFDKEGNDITASSSNIPGYFTSSVILYYPKEDVRIEAYFELIEYRASFNSTDTESGTVTAALGGAVIENNDVVYVDDIIVFTAIPNVGAGRAFDKWVVIVDGVDTNCTETSATLNYAVSGVFSITAHFKLAEFYVSITSSIMSGDVPVGCVLIGDASSSYEYGAPITVTCTVDPHYVFSGWQITVNGITTIKTDSTITYDVKADAEIVALVALEQFLVEAAASPSGFGTVSGAGNYDWDSEVELRALPADGYEFVRWENSLGVPIVSDGTLTIDGSTLTLHNLDAAWQIVALFKISIYTITVNVNLPAGGSAVITEGGSGLTTTAYYGDTVVFTATPNTQYNFLYFKLGDNTYTSNPLSVLITGSADYVAYFEIKKFNVYITINDSGNYGTTPPVAGGSVTSVPSGQVFDYGTDASFTASANTGFDFIGWFEDGMLIESDAILNLTSITLDRAIEARFSLQKVEITALPNDPDFGSVSMSPERAADDMYPFYQTLQFIAIPGNGYDFMAWYKNNVLYDNNALIYVDATENLELEARFKIKEYQVLVSANDPLGGNVSGLIGGGVYEHNSLLELEADVNDDYRFVGWFKGGEFVSRELALSMNVVSGISLEARFVKVYTVALSADTANCAVLEGQGLHDANTAITIRAIANEGYQFDRWVVVDGSNEIVCSLVSDYGLAIVGNISLKAYFIKLKKITVSLSDAKLGEIVGEGYYNVGDEVVLTAETKQNSKFVGWKVNGQIVSTDTSYAFIVANDLDLIAVFNPSDDWVIFVIIGAVVLAAGLAVLGIIFFIRLKKGGAVAVVNTKENKEMFETRAALSNIEPVPVRKLDVAAPSAAAVPIRKTTEIEKPVERQSPQTAVKPTAKKTSTVQKAGTAAKTGTAKKTGAEAKPKTLTPPSSTKPKK